MKIRFLFILSLMLTCSTAAWSQSFSIGGHRAVQDTLNNMWLCSIPQIHFGNDLTATVNFDTEWSNVAIDGNVIDNGEEYTFEGISGGKDYVLTAYMGDSLITGNITFTWLPIVELNGTFSNKYRYGTVVVNEPDSASTGQLSAKVKWRGGATNLAGKNKRNYHIKFINAEDSTKEDHRFFGLRNDNSWILDAGQMDFLRVRNRVSTDLWLDMARRPWYADSLPNARNGSRGTMVEVILNGEYRGIYNMCEPIDRKQLKLKRYEIDENNKVIFHGQIWKTYAWTRTVTMSDPEPRATGATIWDGIELKYPDRDEINRVKWTAMEDAIWFANRSNYNLEACEDSMQYFFDIPIMQDYYLFIVAIQALDNESKNIYYACYDTEDNNRLTMVPWDLDICLGQNYAPNRNEPEQVKPTRHPNEWINHLPMYNMMEVPSYRDEVINRYWELRKTVFNTDSLVNRYRSAVDELENCGAATREENRWSRDTDLARKKLDLSAEMDKVEDWIRQRMEYLDNYVFNRDEPHYIKGDVDGNGEVNIADVNALIDVILSGNTDAYPNPDVDANGEVNINDINEVLAIILG